MHSTLLLNTTVYHDAIFGGKTIEAPNPALSKKKKKKGVVNWIFRRHGILLFWKHVLYLSLKTKSSYIKEFCLCMQPSDYINALLVPKDGQIPVDVQSLAAQGIFRVVLSFLTSS